MKKLLSLLLILVMLSMVACKSPSSETPSNTPKEGVTTPTVSEVDTPEVMDMTTSGSELIKNLTEGNYTNIPENFKHADKLAEVATPAFYQDLWQTIENSYGKYQSHAFNKTVESAPYTTYFYTITFENFIIDFKLTYDTQGLLSGIHYAPLKAVEKEFGSLGGQIITIGEDFPLQGELVLPEGVDTMPLIILVHGSGGTDMDETVGEIKPFYDLAKGLKEQGIASFRYNKRTFVHQVTDIKSFTIYDETIEDVVYAYEQFKNDPRFNGQIYVLGHSLGGHVLPLINAEIPDVNGLIFLAANYSPLTTLIPYQVEYEANFDGELTADEEEAIKQVKALIESLKQLDGTEDGVFLFAGSAYWHQLNNYQPGEILKDIEKPMLFLQGELDFQVPPDEMTFWLNFANQDVTTYHFYSGLSHLMTPGNNPPSARDYQGELKFDQNVINDIATWIKGMK